MQCDWRTQTIDDVPRSTPRPWVEWGILVLAVAYILYLGVWTWASLVAIGAAIVLIGITKRVFPEPGADQVVRPLTSWELEERARMRRGVDACVTPSLARVERFLNIEKPLAVPSWGSLTPWTAVDSEPEMASASVLATSTLTMRSGERETTWPLRTNPNGGMIYGAHPEELSEQALESIRRDALAQVNKALARGASELGIASGVE